MMHHDVRRISLLYLLKGLGEEVTGSYLAHLDFPRSPICTRTHRGRVTEDAHISMRPMRLEAKFHGRTEREVRC